VLDALQPVSRYFAQAGRLEEAGLAEVDGALDAMR
jgi:hypothetical protein